MQDGGREAFEHYAGIVIQEFTAVLQARVTSRRTTSPLRAAEAVGGTRIRPLAVPVPQGLGGPSSADAIALFGHAVFHNAVAWQIARCWGASDEVLADLTALDLGEAEGLWLTKARLLGDDSAQRRFLAWCPSCERAALAPESECAC